MGRHWESSLEGNISDSRYYFPGTIDIPVQTDRRDYLRNRVALSFSNQYAGTDGSIFLYRNGGDHDFFNGILPPQTFRRDLQPFKICIGKKRETNLPWE